MRATRINFRDQRNGSAGWSRRLLHILLLALVIWFGSSQAFAKEFPANVHDADRPVDAIVVLNGGGDRVSESFGLLVHGLAKKLLISGIADGVDMPALLQTLYGRPLPSQQVLDCCV